LKIEEFQKSGFIGDRLFPSLGSKGGGKREKRSKPAKKVGPANKTMTKNGEVWPCQESRKKKMGHGKIDSNGGKTTWRCLKKKRTQRKAPHQNRGLIAS